MATTLATVEAREVLRCDHCSLVQFRTIDSHCRRCRKPLEIEEPEPQLLSLVPAPSHHPIHAPAPQSIDVAKAVRDLRHTRGLSQRELALRMNVPRTYISKIENGKAMPTLSSLERLASALEANICELLHDARSRRQDVVTATMADPFLAELLPYVARMNAYQRSVFLSHVRDMATGRRKPALA
jgi:transcriptional regulator with XRE-family HTH domain